MSSEGNDRVPTPPELNFTLKTESDFNNNDLSSDEIQAQLLLTDILIITASDHESSACYSYMKPIRRCYCEDLYRCVDFGQFGDEDDQNVKVTLMKCELRSNEGQLAVKNAAEILKPKVVLFVGTCASKNPKKAKLGDVVASAKLGTYDRKVMADGTVNYRGAKVSEIMACLILSAADDWKPPLKDPTSLNIEVHCDAVMLSDSNLFDDDKDVVDYCHNALGLEMESAGR
ncbi:5 -methylthioadenosine S-adenosylhomocysteine nucleosidase [Paramuricea clavata]|uniref:5 -methylthioadenosine S-adenosylhomocysteine nucleosidase n=1 Tax=Paramuricea clavata TaxID=317549 RepID=A0A7D9DG36_PARCT|nr:5 -methylthioadenosine S-adenosylhomocysteine nucleosidase [Paramuricea clavata]